MQELFIKLRAHNAKKPSKLLKPSAPFGIATTAEWKAFVDKLEAYDANVGANTEQIDNWASERAAIIRDIRDSAVAEWVGSRFNREAVEYIYDHVRNNSDSVFPEGVFDDFDERMREEVEFFVRNNNKNGLTL